MPYTWDTRKVHLIEAQKFVCLENHKDVYVIHEDVFVPVVPGRYTFVDVKTAYHYYCWSSKLVAPSRQFPVTLPAPSRSDDIYGGIFVRPLPSPTPTTFQVFSKDC